MIKAAGKASGQSEDKRTSAFVKEIEGYIQKAELSGFLQGVGQGLDKGLHVGRLTALIEQLKRRFGPLPEETERRVLSASSEELYLWLMNILLAQNLDDVFKTEEEGAQASPRKASTKSKMH
ncbi:MAG: hypothetical protein RIT26_419 [Pseudomonadota bacterium]|jgi:hypothetical protein